MGTQGNTSSRALLCGIHENVFWFPTALFTSRFLTSSDSDTVNVPQT